ncbi:MAG: DUF6474 family protein [Corynebacterium sp.]|nr:DUF6474 family protein [Corynebacterium sp.]
MADNAKLIAKLYKKDYQRQARALKAQQKLKKRNANREIKKIRLQRKNILRLFTYVQILAPLVLPALYRLAVSLRTPKNANLNQRIDEARLLLAGSSLPAATVADLTKRIDAIAEGAKSAEFLSEDQRRRSQRTLSNDIDVILKELKK